MVYIIFLTHVIGNAVEYTVPVFHIFISSKEQDDTVPDVHLDNPDHANGANSYLEQNVLPFPPNRARPC